MKKQLVLAALAAFSTSPLLADVKVQMQTPEGLVTTFWIGPSKVKMETESASGFVIVDVKEQKQFLIDHNEGMVIDVTAGFSEPGEAAPLNAQDEPANNTVDIRIDKVAEGPKIAGFKSEQYHIKANGTLCSEEFLSTEPFHHPEIVRLLEVIELLGESDINNSELYTPCEQAELTLERQYQNYGMPLRSVNTDGTITSEVVQFKVLDAPPGTYDFPQGYAVTTMRQLMQEQMQNMAPSPH